MSGQTENTIEKTFQRPVHIGGVHRRTDDNGDRDGKKTVFPEIFQCDPVADFQKEYLPYCSGIRYGLQPKVVLRNKIC